MRELPYRGSRFSNVPVKGTGLEFVEIRNRYQDCSREFLFGDRAFPRAHELYRRGSEDGYDMEDWLRTEGGIKQISDALFALLLSGVTVASDESRPSQSLG